MKSSTTSEGRHHSVKSTKQGDFFRLLLPGCYKVTATSGTRSASSDVLIVEGEPTVVHFVFGKDGKTSVHTESPCEVRKDISIDQDENSEFDNIVNDMTEYLKN